MVGADTNVEVDVANVIGLVIVGIVHSIVEVDAANIVRLIVEVDAAPPVVDVYCHRLGGIVA